MGRWRTGRGRVAPIALASVAVLMGGVLLLALGTALTPVFTTSFGLVLPSAFSPPSAPAPGAFTVMIGALAQVAAGDRGTAPGIITGGGSFGQFVFAPIAQNIDFHLGLDGRDVVPWRDRACWRCRWSKPIAGPARHSGAVGASSAMAA